MVSDQRNHTLLNNTNLSLKFLVQKLLKVLKLYTDVTNGIKRQHSDTY